MKKYISTFVLVVIVILLVGATGYTLKEIIQKDKEIVALEQQNEDLSATVKELNEKIESLQDEKLETKEDNETKVEEKSEAIVAVFDTDKVTNAPENSEIVENVYDNNGVLSVSVDNENNSLEIVLNSQLARQIYGYNGQTTSHIVAGISESIVDAKIVSTGKDSSGVKIVMLLESGTVKYIDIANILDGTYTVKTVANVENIVRIVEVSVTDNDSGSVYGAVVGIDKNRDATILSFE